MEVENTLSKKTIVIIYVVICALMFSVFTTKTFKDWKNYFSKNSPQPTTDDTFQPESANTKQISQPEVTNTLDRDKVNFEMFAVRLQEAANEFDAVVNECCSQKTYDEGGLHGLVMGAKAKRETLEKIYMGKIMTLLLAIPILKNEEAQRKVGSATTHLLSAYRGKLKYIYLLSDIEDDPAAEKEFAGPTDPDVRNVSTNIDLAQKEIKQAAKILGSDIIEKD
jgi:hypothetical protein